MSFDARVIREDEATDCDTMIADIVGGSLAHADIGIQSMQCVDNDDDDDDDDVGDVTGVIFYRSVRSTFSSLSIAQIIDDDPCAPNGKVDVEDDPIVVRVQFGVTESETLSPQDRKRVNEMRSYCRRTFKLGDKIRITGGQREAVSHQIRTEWNNARVILNVASTEEANRHVRIQKIKFWSTFQCQAWQKRFNPNINASNGTAGNNTSNKQQAKRKAGTEGRQDSNGHGATDIPKRLQAGYVAAFLVHAIMHKIAKEEGLQDALQMLASDGCDWTKLDSTHNVDVNGKSSVGTTGGTAELATLKARAIAYLNSGSGVIDAAGGSGHVSMALGLAGVQSTVVDPRPTVGKLPGRDRKIWNRALKLKPPPMPPPTASSNPDSSAEASKLYCQPVPFQAHRAWFGAPPVGVERSFRLPDDEEKEIPVVAHDRS